MPLQGQNRSAQYRVADHSTHERMKEFASLKYTKPLHSQLHTNQFELLCIDDDPVFQVVPQNLCF